MIDVSMHGPLPSGINETDIRSALRSVFSSARRPARGGVAVVFVAPARMRKLNREWRGKNRPTDVLSFAPPSVPMHAPHSWGDIVLCPSYIRSEARRRGIPFREELLRVTIHGMLHLFGHDHATARDERRMFGLQERALTRVLPRNV